MRKSHFNKKVIHTRQGEIIQYYGNDKSLLKIFPHKGNLDPELHSHQFYVILWIKKGSGIHTINYEDYPIKDNQIFFLSPGDIHNAICTNVDDIGISFREEILDLLPPNIAERIRFDVFSCIGKSPIATIDANTAKSLDRWIEMLKSLLIKHNNDTNYCTAAVLSVILKFLKENAIWENDSLNLDPQKKKIIGKLKKAINANLKNSHSLAFYSIEIGVPESKLSAIVKELYGISPKKMINREIILKAKELLAEDKLIIKEISENLGFADAPHFVKFFKKETGMTPSQFKETL